MSATSRTYVGEGSALAGLIHGTVHVSSQPFAADKGVLFPRSSTAKG